MVVTNHPQMVGFIVGLTIYKRNGGLMVLLERRFRMLMKKDGPIMGYIYPLPIKHVKSKIDADFNMVYCKGKIIQQKNSGIHLISRDGSNLLSVGDLPNLPKSTEVSI